MSPLDPPSPRLWLFPSRARVTEEDVRAFVLPLKEKEDEALASTAWDHYILNPTRARKDMPRQTHEPGNDFERARDIKWIHRTQTALDGLQAALDADHGLPDLIRTDVGRAIRRAGHLVRKQDREAHRHNSYDQGEATTLVRLCKYAMDIEPCPYFPTGGDDDTQLDMFNK